MKKFEDDYKVIATVYPELEKKQSTKATAAKTAQSPAPLKEVAKAASVEAKKVEVVSSPVKQEGVKKQESVSKK